MDPEEIEKHIGKNYRVDIEDIDVNLNQDVLEIDEDNMPMSLRTEKKNRDQGLEEAVNYTKL
jgi:hypothetical protein